MTKVFGSETKDHPIFAAVYSALSNHFDSPLFGEVRMALLHNQCGQILEIGAGTGANMPYFDPAAKVTFCEPDRFMMKHLRETMHKSKRNFELVQARAESLPFANGTFDTVLATLVFCSIDRPAAALSEIRRILKPHGQLIFLEHVAASQPLLRHLQGFMTPIWRHLAGGCHLNRDTMSSISEAGYQIIECQQVRDSMAGLLPFVAGRAVA